MSHAYRQALSEICAIFNRRVAGSLQPADDALWIVFVYAPMAETDTLAGRVGYPIMVTRGSVAAR
jgi:hypothetical protein